MKNKFWNFVNSKDEPRELIFDGVVAEESWFEDDITPKLFRDELNSGSGDVVVRINSPGGDCIAASQIYTMLREYKGNVQVKVDGLAASAASVIAMAGDQVLMSPTAMMMIHNPMTIAFGDHNDMAHAIDELEAVKESIINAYALKTGLSRNEISTLMEDETWMDANAAIDYGFADSIIGKDVKEDDEQDDEEDEKKEDNKKVTNKVVFSQRKSNLKLVAIAKKTIQKDEANNMVDATPYLERLRAIKQFVK